MEKSGFFNALKSSAGTYDRNYLAEDFASYFSRFISNGVFPNPSTGLQVLANAIPDMSITLQPGYAYINGYTYQNTAPITFEIGIADGVFNRKDAIFIRYDKIGRLISAIKVAGTPGVMAVAPAPSRTSDYWDICVAIIDISAGAVSIQQSNIVDTRMNLDVCGIVTGLIEQVDTTTLYNQVQNDLAQFKSVSQAEFNAWFADINAKLGTEPATALQGQVDKIIAGQTIVGKATSAEKLGDKLESALSVANAAKFGNFPVDDFIRHRMPAIACPNNNLDELHGNYIGGVANVLGTPLGVPNTGYIISTDYRGTDSWGSQIFIPDLPSNISLWIRTATAPTGNSWGAWKNISDAVLPTQGALSGVNALTWAGSQTKSQQVQLHNNCTGTPIDGNWWLGDLKCMGQWRELTLTDVNNPQLTFRNTAPATNNWIGWRKPDADTVDGFHIQKCTQAAYNAIPVKDANAIYLIAG